MKRFIIILGILIIAMAAGMIYLFVTDIHVERKLVQKNIFIPSSSTESLK
jgi:hypothetical protein